MRKEEIKTADTGAGIKLVSGSSPPEMNGYFVRFAIDIDQSGR